MELRANDSKKLFKVFDASKRKRVRKKPGDDYSAGTDGSNSGACTGGRAAVTPRDSLPKLAATSQGDGPDGRHSPERKRDGDGRRGSTSPSRSNSPAVTVRKQASPERYKRKHGLSLALKAGLVSTPKSSLSPRQDSDGIGRLPRDQDSFLYAFLEDAIKKDKKRHRRRSHHRHEEPCEPEPEPREPAEPPDEHERRHRHRRRHRDSRDRTRRQSESPNAAVDQAIILKTLAKICTQLKEQVSPERRRQGSVSRLHSTKSLQCDVKTNDACVSHRGPEVSPSYSVYNGPGDQGTRGPPPSPDRRAHRYHYDYGDSRTLRPDGSGHRVDKYRDRDYPPPSRSCIDHSPHAQPSNHRACERDPRPSYDNRKYLGQQASRSFDVQRTMYPEEGTLQRTARSDLSRKRHDERDYRDSRRDRRYEEPRGKYDNGIRESAHREMGRRESMVVSDRRRRGTLERGERYAASRDDVRDRVSERGRESDGRDRVSERERESDVSVADGENSTVVSGKSNYLKVVKQEIAEQREAMDKMMKLWKELMRCFKGVSSGAAAAPGPDRARQAAGVEQSAAAQLQLWRECMRRYETVARDVGDTDARLMEEINKQRSEMAEMATMWQECLQRYRDISNDFNSLKKKLNESPTRSAAPLAEGEPPMPAPAYHMPPYMAPPMAHPMVPPFGGPPLRQRASAGSPPAWWWGGDSPQRRRRSSPESRGSGRRDRDRRRHRDCKDHDESKYKEKCKLSSGRSEHRHRKR